MLWLADLDAPDPALAGPQLRLCPADSPPAALAALRHDPSGRPWLPDSPFDVSLARRGGRLLVGWLAGGRLGVDLEAAVAGLDLDALAAGVCTPAEQVWWRAQPDLGAAFYTLWTAKEAWLKALGVGLPYGLQQAEFAAGPDGRLAPATLGGRASVARGWHYAGGRREGLVFAVVWAGLDK